MPENAAKAAVPLKVSITNRPPLKQGGIGNDIAIEKGAAIVKDVLEHCKYDGTWTLAFVRQTKKRFNIKFQVSRREGPKSLLIRTKPFDNGSCWESILTPPEKYSITEVTSQLEKVHPTRLVIKQLTNSDISNLFAPKLPPILPSEKFNPDPRRTLKDVILSFTQSYPKGFKIEDLVREFRKVGMKPHEEKEVAQSARTVLNSLVVAGVLTRDAENRFGKPTKDFPAPVHQLPTTVLEKIKVEKAELDEVEREIQSRLKKQDEPKVEKVVEKKDEETVDLILKHDCEVPLHTNHNAVSLALVALYISIGEDKHRAIYTNEATNILISKLNLDDFVENQDHYSKADKAASSLLKGLVAYGYIVREHYNSKGDHKYTKNYNLTTKGIDAACAWSKSTPRIERPPVMPPVTPSVIPVPIVPVTEPTTVTAAVVEQNMGNLQPLVKELERFKSSIVTYDELEKQIQLDLNTTQDAISGLESRIKDLSEQLKLLNERMDTYKAQEQQLRNDFSDAGLHKEDEKRRMDDTKRQIQTILGKLN